MGADQQTTKKSTACPRCSSPTEGGDLRCAVCGQSLVTGRDPETGDRVSVQVMRCKGCGAAVSYSVERRAPHCAFCGSVIVIETSSDPQEKTEGYLPFLVDPPLAREALRRWLGSLGFFRPAGLKSDARLESLEPLWWVGWSFDVQVQISWTADSDAGSRRSAWAPHAGQVPITFERILVPASRGLTDEEARQLVSSYDLGTTRPRPEGNDQATMEEFDVDRSFARRRIIAAIQATAAQRVASEHIPGRRHRNVHVATLLRGLNTRRLAFPAYIMAYSYRKRLYRAVISGQDADNMTASAPLSWLKIAAVAAGAALLSGIAALLIALQLQ